MNGFYLQPRGLYDGLFLITLTKKCLYVRLWRLVFNIGDDD